MQVANDFFECKENGGERGVKRGSNGGCSADGKKGFHFFFAQTKTAAENGSDPSANLHGRTFATERNAAGNGSGGTKEFPEDGFDRDVTFPCEQGRFRLRHAAAARFGEKFK